jgi:iron complex outermembrane recepter protein
MPISCKGRLRALLLAGSALAAPAAAVADEPPMAVDAVIVTARPDPDDPPVVAQVRARLSETPGAVAVVAAESYASRYAPGLSEMLRDVPGVYAQRKWGEDMRMSIRGSGIGNPNHNRGTLLAQDGVPFNEADGFGDFQLIDPLIARYTEVYKGGNALRFGGALLGGAVNLVTPTGRTGTSQVRVDGGAHQTLRGHLEAAHASGDWDLFVAATGVTANGWRDQADQTSARLSFNLGRAFGEDREVRLIVAAADVQQEIPGSLTLEAALQTPRRAAQANLDGEYQRNMRSVRSSLQARWRLSATTLLEAGAYASWKDLDHPIFQVIDQESRNYGGFARLDWDGRLFGLRSDAFAGGWLRLGDLDARQWRNEKSSRGELTAQSRQNARAADVFFEGRLFVAEQLALVGGGSFGWADRTFHDLRAPERDAEKTYQWFAPRVGLLWEANDGAQAFANLTRSVEPPNFSALAQTSPHLPPGFAPLSAQEAWTAEVGARGRRGAFTWDVTLYRAELEHELLNFTVTPDTPVAQFNAGATVHQGLEAGLDWRIRPDLRLRQTYAWSDFHFDGDETYVDNRLPVAPEHLYRAELRYEHPAGWFVAPSVEWSPADTFVDYANRFKAPGYAIWSLNGGWRGKDGLELFAEVRNLADERYVSNFSPVIDWATTPATPAVFFPGEGRSVYGGVTWRF